MWIMTNQAKDIVSSQDLLLCVCVCVWRWFTFLFTWATCWTMNVLYLVRLQQCSLELMWVISANHRLITRFVFYWSIWCKDGVAIKRWCHFKGISSEMSINSAYFSISHTLLPLLKITPCTTFIHSLLSRATSTKSKDWHPDTRDDLLHSKCKTASFQRVNYGVSIHDESYLITDTREEKLNTNKPGTPSKRIIQYGPNGSQIGTKRRRGFKP